MNKSEYINIISKLEIKIGELEEENKRLKMKGELTGVILDEEEKKLINSEKKPIYLKNISRDKSNNNLLQNKKLVDYIYSSFYNKINK